MAYWVQETGTHHNSSNYRSFMCDYRSDIDKLPRVGIEGEKQEGDTVSSSPCAYGSLCHCLEDSSRWVLGRDINKWIRQNSVPQGSSGSAATENNYNNLINKPSINNVELSGNLSLEALGIETASSDSSGDDINFDDMF